MKALRRAAVGAAGAAAVLGLAAGPAFAHECFNASRTAQANTMLAEHSHGWVQMQTWQLYAIFLGTPCDPSSGPCPPVPSDVQPLIDAQTNGTLDSNTVFAVILGFAPESALGSLSGAYDALVALSQLATTDAACLGVPTSYMTLANSTMAGGAPTKVVSDGKGAEHFPDAYGAQLFQAYGTVLATGTASDCPSS